MAKITEAQLDAMASRIESISNQLKSLRDRELKKSLIPVHDHKAGTISGAGVEDVPPLKVNPKGTAKAEKCMKCGDMHAPLTKCGQKLPTPSVKSELVDAKGKHSSNSVVTPFNDDPKKTPSTSAPKLPGAMKKKALPMDKNAATPALNAMRAKAAGAPAGKPTLSSNKTPALAALRSRAAAGAWKPAAPAPALKAEVPMAKPPSGKDMATHVPISKPATPATKNELEKGFLGDAAKHTDPMVASHAAHVASVNPAATPKPKAMPTPQQHATRASAYGSALAGAFKPQGKVVSGLELASPRPGIFGVLSNKQKS